MNAKTLCWAFMLDQLALVDAAVQVKYTPEWAAVRQYLWNMVHRGPDDAGFADFVRDAMTSAAEILDGTVDPQQAVALLNRNLRVVNESEEQEDDHEPQS